MARFLVGLVGVAIAWCMCSEICAQSRKRRDTPPGIAERGKLLFEDDFSEKELLWTFDAEAGEWGIAKKALVTRSIRGEGQGYTWSSIGRHFTPTDNVILEMRALVPADSAVTVSLSFTGAAPRTPKNAPPLPDCGTIRGCVTPDTKTMAIQLHKRGQKPEQLVVGAFPYTKQRWINLVFEVLEGKYALTVDGRTIVYEEAGAARAPKSGVSLVLWTAKELQGPVVIDDVAVWEALQKDEEEEKGKKRGN